MKPTAIVRFDGSCLLIVDGKSLFFETYEKLEEYCKKNDVIVKVTHFHPASGLRMNHG